MTRVIDDVAVYSICCEESSSVERRSTPMLSSQYDDKQSIEANKKCKIKYNRYENLNAK